ncbi:hypothetical protein TL18_01885 [Methanobrevibacter sp. YE315]|nr:hypothetical protein TL18_01885 [Methanobrevibacter sp. YE315]
MIQIIKNRNLLLILSVLTLTLTIVKLDSTLTLPVVNVKKIEENNSKKVCGECFPKKHYNSYKISNN